MAKITPIRVTEQFEHFMRELKESFGGDLYGQTRLAWKRFWEAESIRERDSYMQTGWHDRAEKGQRDRLPERILRAGLCDTAGNHSAADCAYARSELPAARRVLHQRCWAHKMRNILEKVERHDYDALKADGRLSI